MAMRCRKSVKIAPGIRLNINKNSVGISAGVKGARVTANSNGRVTRSVGIPGTGLYDVETIKSSQSDNSGKIQQNGKKATQKRKTHFVLFVVLAVILCLSGFVTLADSDYTGGALCIILGCLFAFLAYRSKKKR